MTDIHTHILPGLDDGAQSVYDTIEMAAMAFESGTRCIVATPHCNIPGLYDNYFGDRYIQAFKSAQEALRGEGIPVELLPGMEVFATEDLPDLLTAGRIMSLNQTRNILIEFDFGEDPLFADQVLRRVREVGGCPVIAHAERFEFVQDDPRIVYRWQERGYGVQVNKGSFMGRFGSRAERTAYRLLNHNLITAVASDAHSPVRRTTYMADAYDILAEGYPENYLDILFEKNPMLLCQGKQPVQFKRIPFEGEENMIE